RMTWSISIAFQHRKRGYAHSRTADSTWRTSNNPLWKGGRMTSWPIGLSTGCFYHQSILDCLPLIRESGFSMIEVCSSPEHVDFHDADLVRRAAQRINELGMEAYSFHAPFAQNIDIASSNSAQRTESVAEIFKAAEAATLLRVHYFVLHPGPENPAPIPTEERLPRMQHVVESLNQVARH